MRRALFTGMLFSLVVVGAGCDASSSSSTVKPAVVTATDDSWIRSGATPVEEHGQLRVSGTKLLDQNGDVVQLKGVSSMWLNWENDGFAENAVALLWMRDHWNLSVIRAAMGVEPSGAYLSSPDRAKQQVETIVENAIAAGVYVIIDWHDHHASDHQEQAVAFFTEMAQKYGDQPNVIYETFNEPEKVKASPQADWAEVIKPYHETVVAAIRGADADNIVLLGTPTWDQDVEVAAASPLDGSNLMYTVHFYSCTHTSWLRSKATQALSAGLPLFASEWGATNADGGTDGTICLDEATVWINWLSSNHVGWTAWKLDNCPVDSTCLLDASAPVGGGWDSEYMHVGSHAFFVRDALRQ